MKVKKDINKAICTSASVRKAGISSAAVVYELFAKSAYTDPVTAPIRELICNARDAHIAAGLTDVPIYVELPSFNNSLFIVRDYGAGMSAEEINSNYLDIGTSTKSDSNAYIGCMGIGSKAPLAYTNSYSFYSYQNGMLNSYTLNSIDGESPDVVPMHVCAETDEPDGFRVEFKVKDVSEFREKFIDFWRYFDYPLNVINTGNNTIPATKPTTFYTLETPDLAIERRTYSSDSLAVLMGGVLYAAPTALLNSAVKSKLKQLEDVLPYWSKIIVKANIGDIDISASRETIKASKETLEFINTKISTLSKDSVTLMYKRFKNWDSLQSFYEKFSTICRDLEAHSVSSSVGSPIKDELVAELLQTIKSKYADRKVADYPIITNAWGHAKTRWGRQHLAFLTESQWRLPDTYKINMLYSPGGIVDGAFKEKCNTEHRRGIVICDEPLRDAFVSLGFNVQDSIHKPRTKNRSLGEGRYYEFQQKSGDANSFAMKGRKPTLSALKQIAKERALTYVAMTSSDTPSDVLDVSLNPGMDKHLPDHVYITPAVIHAALSVHNRLCKPEWQPYCDYVSTDLPDIFITNNADAYNAAISSGIKPLSAFFDRLFTFNRKDMARIRRLVIESASYYNVVRYIASPLIEHMNPGAEYSKLMLDARRVRASKKTLHADRLVAKLQHLSNAFRYKGLAVLELIKEYNKIHAEAIELDAACTVRYPLLDKDSRKTLTTVPDHILAYIKFCEKEARKASKGGEE